MLEIGIGVAIAAVAFVVGMLVGGAIAYEKGWKAGTAWAQRRLFGY